MHPYFLNKSYLQWTSENCRTMKSWECNSTTSYFSSFKLHNWGHTTTTTLGGQLKFFYPVPFNWFQCDTYVIGRGIVPSQVEKPNFGDYHRCSCHLGVHCSQSVPHCYGRGWRSHDLWIFCRYLSIISLFQLLFCSRDQGQKRSGTQQPVSPIGENPFEWGLRGLLCLGNQKREQK